MSNKRRNRLNLSVKKTDASKSPTTANNATLDVIEIDGVRNFEIGTPPNCRKRASTIEFSPPYDIDSSPVIHMSQDANVIISGVAWAWNSPKRAIINEQRHRIRPLFNNNVISHKKKTEKLTGFYKFQNELKLLQEADEANIASKLESEDSSVSLKVHPSTSPPDNENTLTTSNSKNDGIVNEAQQQKCSEVILNDSLNDSYLDKLLLQASQAIENTACSPTITNLTSNCKDKEKAAKRKSFFKSRTTDNFDLASCDLNDSDFDSFLVETSQQVENIIEDGKKYYSESMDTTRKNLVLTRHKSMPETPTHKKSSTQQPPLTSQVGLVPTHTSTDNTTDDLIIIQPRSVHIDISSSNSSSNSCKSYDRKCTKEEIEQKRLEAVRRQKASRLKRLIQDTGK